MTCNKTIQLKTVWKRMLAILMIVAVVCTVASCKNSKVPSKKEIYDKIVSKNAGQVSQEAGVFTYKELCSSWGKPDVERTDKDTQVNYRAWKYQDDYIYAVLEKDDSNSVNCFGTSIKQQMICLYKDDYSVYFLLLYSETPSIDNVVEFELDQLKSGEVDNAKFGDLFDLDYNGIVLTCYPGIIEGFYSITSTGKADESQMELAQQAKEQLFNEAIWVLDE